MISSLIMPKSNVYKTVFGFYSGSWCTANFGSGFLWGRRFSVASPPKMTMPWYFLKRSIQTIETHWLSSQSFFFSISDDGSTKYRIAGRNALLRWDSKSTYFIMICFKLDNISRHLKDLRLAAKGPLSTYKPIKPLSSHWLTLAIYVKPKTTRFKMKYIWTTLKRLLVNQCF